MSDPAADQLEGTAPPSPDRGYLTPAAIDAVLADFRTWLTELQTPPMAVNRPFDLSTVVAQFTALRHEVNLQTKAARAATDQASAALERLSSPPTSPPVPTPLARPDEQLRPLLKTLLDIRDALSTAGHRAEQAAGEPAAVRVEPPRPGWWARRFAPKPTPTTEDPTSKLRQKLAAVADGYAMSLRRIDAVLPTFGVEPIKAADQPFDAELMEVVDTVSGTGRPVGTVVEVVRPGYRWHGTIWRYAQVKVAT